MRLECLLPLGKIPRGHDIAAPQQDGLAVEWQEGPPGLRRSGKAMEEGEYPVIGYAPNGAPQFGSMRMKVIEEKMVDGYKMKVLPAGYAEGAYPSKNASVRS
jgi:hypothetical protein